MRIVDLRPQPNHTLHIVSDDGRSGIFDVRPYLEYEAFAELKDTSEFLKVSNGGYFVEWACGADLSADSIEALWNEANRTQDAACDGNKATAVRTE